MFFNDELKDCELHTNDGEILKCHKILLLARLPIFEGMFSRNMGASRSFIVKIPDFNKQTMNQLLRFVYNLPIENLNEIAHDLILVSEQYQNEALKKICIGSLIEILNKENVLRSLIIASETNGTESLFHACADFIARNYRDLKDTPEWRNLPRHTLMTLLDIMMPHYNSQNMYSHASN